MSIDEIVEAQRRERILRKNPHLAKPIAVPKDVIDEFKIEISSKDKISFLLPFRGADRIEPLLKCVENLLKRYPTSEIIIIEESVKRVIDRPIPGSRYCFIYSKKAFNKSRCFNIGMLIASHDVICGLDCDMLIPSTLFNFNKEYILKDKVVFPGKDIYYVSKTITPDTLNADGMWDHKTWLNSRAEWQFHGGIWICTKKAFAKVGGFDQRYFGYGSEDSSFYLRSTESDNAETSKNITLLHIEHNYTNELLERIEINKSLLFAESRLNPLDRIKDCKKYNIFWSNE